MNNLLIGIIGGTFCGFALGVLWVMAILDTAERDIIRRTYKNRGQKLQE